MWIDGWTFSRHLEQSRFLFTNNWRMPLHWSNLYLLATCTLLWLPMASFSPIISNWFCCYVLKEIFQEWKFIRSLPSFRYFIVTSKHHDGFTNWKSNVSWNWNSVDTGPHKDLIGKLILSVSLVSSFVIYSESGCFFIVIFLQTE